MFGGEARGVEGGLCLPHPGHSWHRGLVSTDSQRGSTPPRGRPPSGVSENEKPPGRPPRIRVAWWIALVIGLFAINYYAGSRATQSPSRVRVPYSPFFLKQVTAGHVKEITSKGTAIQGTFTQKETYNGSKATTRFKTEVPTFANTDALSQLLQRKGVVVNAQPLQTGAPWWENLLLGFGPTLLFLLLLVWLMRRAGNVQGMLGAFGRSRARRYEPSGDRVTFADVAGIDEAKAELTEVVDFLRTPDKYLKLGGRIPHGVLLAGPPGTGKTLLARAVAGEANVPFFSMSASEFVEAIVGIGASRVRDLFAQAKEAAPAIVFNDEREQTLNQILTEMDGFDSSTSVIVIGATNRPDVLDQALLRPGRFDRRVAVQPPDRAGREAILEVHTRGVPLGPDVDLGRIAATTPGMVGADLANLVNEAALLAARRNHDVVMEADVTDALERIVLGAERQVMMSHEDKRRTAYHEGGHAIVGMLTEGADPVRKISIIPRGVSLGVTFSAPEADRYSYERRELEAKIKVALGGRSAEEIVFDEPTTGAESDIQQLTEIARQMVGRWGMSTKIGPVAVTPVDGRGPFLPGAAEVSQHTQELIDDEVRRIVEAAHEQVVALLKENRDKLDSLAAALLEHETLDEDEAYAAAHVERRPDDATGALAPAARSAV
ncbi:MAG: ATP-dependent zinc metalloprotease FtsH [Actinobacteria bacterium]|nr:MAG: ATP-dependent zinc metalloprotease FtsH [Actinomycetota bacterium]